MPFWQKVKTLVLSELFSGIVECTDRRPKAHKIRVEKQGGYKGSGPVYWMKEGAGRPGPGLAAAIASRNSPLSAGAPVFSAEECSGLESIGAECAWRHVHGQRNLMRHSESLSQKSHPDQISENNMI